MTVTFHVHHPHLHAHPGPVLAGMVGIVFGAAGVAVATAARLTTSEVALIVPVITAALSVAAAFILDRHRPSRWSNRDALAEDNRRLRARVRELERKLRGEP